MEVILKKGCESLTGSLSRGHGYFIQRRGSRFFGQRSKYGAPPNGHWQFIKACAALAVNGLHVQEIRISAKELREALLEARAFIAAQNLRREVYNARDVLNLKTTFGL